MMQPFIGPGGAKSDITPAGDGYAFWLYEAGTETLIFSTKAEPTKFYAYGGVTKDLENEWFCDTLFEPPSGNRRIRDLDRIIEKTAGTFKVSLDGWKPAVIRAQNLTHGLAVLSNNAMF